MTRDYKNISRSRSGRAGKPVVMGITIGLMLGILIAIAVAIYVNRAPSPFVNKTQTIEKPSRVETARATEVMKPLVSDPAGAEAISAEAKDKPRFDFYDILPGESSQTPSAAPQPKAPASQPREKAAPGAQYYLQAGSFSGMSEADKLKAKLALMGLEASVRPASVPDKGLVHRVRVGPFKSADEMNRVRSALSQNGISASVVKATN